ncbi:MAG: adenosylcobinamide-GDP ribazoletransferase [Solirubrobacteraceae bacterium]
MLLPSTGARHAVGFLTRVPVRFADGERPRLDLAVPWFPIVGLLVGGLSAGVLALVDLLPGAGPAGIAAALGLAAGIAVTGALHEDGLADCADGLGVLGDRERRLAVMRDPRIGTFGTLALVVWALVCWSALRALPTADAVTALLASATLGRAAILPHAALGRPARPDGAIHALHVGPAGGATAALVAGAVVGVTLGPVAGAVALGAGALVVAATTAGARAGFGGITGDTCGATATLVQASVLVVALAFVA